MNTRSRLVLIGVAIVVLWSVFALLRSSAVANAPPREGPFIAFGDSLTEGVGAPPEGAYPAHLSGILGIPVLNRGVRGETASEALRRLENQVLKLQPGCVFVCLGGNDILQRRKIDETFNALEQIVSRIAEEGSMVVLIGVEGVPLLSADYDSRFESLAEEYGCLYVPDILDGIIGRGELMSDNVHPNSAGYARIAGRIAAAVRPYLNP